MDYAALDSVTATAFTPGGRTLASSSADGTVILWDLADPADPRPLSEPLGAHTDEVWSVSFSLDGQTLATGSSDNSAALWDLRSLQELRGDPVRRACAQAGGLSPQEWERFVPGLPYADACAP